MTQRGAVARAIAVAVTVAWASGGCGSVPVKTSYDADSGLWLSGRQSTAQEGGTLSVRWREKLAPEYHGAFVPLQRASAALDPRDNRLYVGTTHGALYAISGSGGRIYRYDAEAAIESRPALDRKADELYVGTDEGIVHALETEEGTMRWRENVGGPVRKQPLVREDAVYVVTDTDHVVALSREDGAILWTHQRQPPQGFTITTHAGLTLAEDKLLTGYSDGVVEALDPSSGEVVWKHNTSLDLEAKEGSKRRFLDVDTTPIVVGDRVYVASYTAGVYALELSSGSVIWREPEFRGVTSIAHAGGTLVVSSADRGLFCLELPSRTVRWRHDISRGSPAHPTIVENGLVLVGETGGSLLAISLASGQELARVDAGTGFNAPVSVAGRRAFALSNGGSLFALQISGQAEPREGQGSGT